MGANGRDVRTSGTILVFFSRAACVMEIKMIEDV
jgi:hypothetical protein